MRVICMICEPEVGRTFNPCDPVSHGLCDRHAAEELAKVRALVMEDDHPTVPLRRPVHHDRAGS